MTGPTGNCSQHCPCGKSDEEAQHGPHLVNYYMMASHTHTEPGTDCVGCVMLLWSAGYTQALEDIGNYEYKPWPREEIDRKAELD